MKNIFLLDNDETIMDFKRSERETLKSTLEAFGVPAGESALARFHEINDGLWKQLERGEIERGRLVVVRFERLFAELGVTADATRVSTAYFEGMKHSAYYLDGAEDFLRALAHLGRIYLVTNGAAEIQRSRIALAGMEQYLSGAFISEEVGYDKPSPLFAEHVERSIPEYECSRAVWIGDSLSSDRLCAESKGIDFILFAPHGAPAGYAGKFASSHSEMLRVIADFGEADANQ